MNILCELMGVMKRTKREEKRREQYLHYQQFTSVYLCMIKDYKYSLNSMK